MKKHLLHNSIHNMEEVESTVSNETQQAVQQTDNVPINPDVILNEKGQAVYVFEKFSREQWESIEKPVDPVTQSVLNLLVSAGSRNDLHNVADGHRVKACGETAYVETVRPVLASKGYLVSAESSSDSDSDGDNEAPKGKGKGGNKKTKGKKAKGKKAAMKSIDRIRLENFKTTVKGDTDELFGLLGTSRERAVPWGLNHSLVELRLVTLYCLAKFSLDSVRQSTKSRLADIEEDVYRTIQTIQMVLENIDKHQFGSALNPIDRISVAATLVQDLAEINRLLKRAVSYRVSKIFEHYPQLTDPTRYHAVLPELAIQLNSCQSQLIDLCRSNRSYMLFYSSNFGSGKTTATIGITATTLAKPGESVIYCCMSEAVRHNLAKYAYNAGIPFAIAVTVSQRHVRIINNKHCRSDEARKLIITDYLTAYELVRHHRHHLPHQTRERIILMVDEPTDGADAPFHFKTTVFGRLFAYCPSRTILVSATLPTREQLQPYVDHFTSEWGHLKPIFETIQSNRVKIGCQLIDREGNAFVCHQFVKNRTQLERLIELLASNQFLGRLYTAPIVYHLRDQLERAGIPELPNLEQYFAQVNRLNCENIKEVAIQLLRLLLQHGSEELIPTICGATIRLCHRTDLYGRENAAKISPCFEFDKLGTSDAYKFLGPTLLVTSDPSRAVIDYFEQLLKNEDASKLIKHYLKNKEAEEKAFQKFEKSMERDKQEKRKRKKDDSSSAQPVDTREKREKELDEMLENLDSDINFPISKQINTYAHLRRYASAELDVDAFNLSKIRANQCLTLIPFDADVLPDVMLRLFAGVGMLVAETHGGFDARYSHEVVRQTLEGTLAYTVSDEAIIFGVNSPADNLIVEDSAVASRSISTVFQLLARVGRPGLSWTASAYIGPELRDQLVGYLTNGEQGVKPIDNEPENMNTVLQYVLEEQRRDRESGADNAPTVKPFQFLKPTKAKRPALAKRFSKPLPRRPPPRVQPVVREHTGPVRTLDDIGMGVKKPTKKTATHGIAATLFGGSNIFLEARAEAQRQHRETTHSGGRRRDGDRERGEGWSDRGRGDGRRERRTRQPTPPWLARHQRNQQHRGYNPADFPGWTPPEPENPELTLDRRQMGTRSEPSAPRPQPRAPRREERPVKPPSYPTITRDQMGQDVAPRSSATRKPATCDRRPPPPAGRRTTGVLSRDQMGQKQGKTKKD